LEVISLTINKQDNNISHKLIEGNYEYQRFLLQNRSDIGTISKNPILILTCMDPRIDVFSIFQLTPGDAFILRNAGNVFTEDILRSVLIAVNEYNIENIFVLGHIDCDMKKINLNKLREKLNLTTLKRIGKHGTNIQFEFIKYFKVFVDEIRNVKNQVNHLYDSKEIPRNIKIRGMLYDINTGWVFNVSNFGEQISYESFQANRKKIFMQKNSDYKEYIGSIERESIGEESLLKEETNIELESSEIELKKTTPNQSMEVLEKIEETIHQFQNNLNISKIYIPQISVPKIKVHVPTVYKKGNNKQD